MKLVLRSWDGIDAGGGASPQRCSSLGPWHFRSGDTVLQGKILLVQWVVDK